MGRRKQAQSRIGTCSRSPATSTLTRFLFIITVGYPYGLASLGRSGTPEAFHGRKYNSGFAEFLPQRNSREYTRTRAPPSSTPPKAGRKGQSEWRTHGRMNSVRNMNSDQRLRKTKACIQEVAGRVSRGCGRHLTGAPIFLSPCSCLDIRQRGKKSGVKDGPRDSQRVRRPSRAEQITSAVRGTPRVAPSSRRWPPRPDASASRASSWWAIRGFPIVAR